MLIEKQLAFKVAKIQRIKLKQLTTALALAIMLFTSVAFAQEFTKGFATDDRLLRGAVVAINQDDNSKVTASTFSNIQQLYGVVVQSNETPVSLSSDTSGVYVASSGRFEVLVSNVNGAIVDGDYISVSSIKSIGMKASAEQELVLGRALQDFDVTDSANIQSTTTVTDAAGKMFDVAIGRILVDVEVRKNPLASIGSAPDILLQYGEAIAGQEVTLVRVYASLAILFVSVGLGGSMLYAGIRTSMVAIGRNPLSKTSVLKGFTRVAFTSATIFLGGFFAIYLILRL